MKTCSICNNQLDDSAAFCTVCGTKFASQQPGYGSQQPDYNGQQPGYGVPGYGAPPVPSYDHTAEFDAKDISDNKVISMLVYLLGTFGIIIALLASGNSPYASFHVRQALKFTVTQILATICMFLLCWTLIVPLAYIILMFAFGIIKLICFFQICSGKAIEPAIIRNLPFLK